MSKAERYYQTGRDAVLYQNALHREFSDRAFNLLNLGVASSVAVAVVFNLRLDDVQFDRSMLFGLGVLGVAFFFLLTSCISVLNSRNRAEHPSLDELRDMVSNNVHNEDSVFRSLGDNAREVVQFNDRLLDYLSGALTRAMIALVVMFLSLIYILVEIFWRSPEAPVCELARLVS